MKHRTGFLSHARSACTATKWRARAKDLRTQVPCDMIFETLLALGEKLVLITGLGLASPPQGLEQRMQKVFIP